MLTQVQSNVIYRGKVLLKGEKAEIDNADVRLKFFKPQTNAPPIEEPPIEEPPEVEDKLPPLGKRK